MRWRHSIIPPDQPTETPKLGDFFKKGLAAHVVREISQNTMDGRRRGELAQLRFSFTPPPDADAFKPLLSGLREHVEDSKIEGADVDWLAPQLLLIEDFGTRGLEGPTDDKDADGSFAKFWYRTGDSNKKQGSGKGGRHGVGKVVNAEASRVRAYLGYSVPASGEALSSLMGRSYLKPHGKYHGLGTFHGGVEKFQPLLGADADMLAKKIGFARQSDMPGLSLAVLWPKEEVGGEQIREAVLAECIYPLTTGELTVAINGQSIDASNVEVEISRHRDAEKLLKMHELIRGLPNTSSAFRKPVIEIDPRKPETRLSRDSFDDKTLEVMRGAWLAGEPVFVEAAIRLMKKAGGEIVSPFRLAMAHADSKAGSALCVRDGISVRRAITWNKAAVALLIAEKSEVSEFLSEAEGPSHEDWDAEYVKDRYSYAPQTIRAIKASIQGFYDLLASGQDDAPIENALINFFLGSLRKALQKSRRRCLSLRHLW